VTRGTDGVGCAPGFFTTFGDGESLGEVVEFLESVGDFDLARELASDRFAEGLGEVFTDDEDHFGKSGAHGIEDRVVEDGLTIWAHGIHLFQAPISGAHSCCENDECGGICHAEEISTGEAEKGNGFLVKKVFLGDGEG